MFYRLKANLILVIIVLVTYIPAMLYLKHSVLQQNKEYVVKQASILMESALAVRSYTVDQVKPQLDPMLEQKFLPQTVPAFAATETFERFRKKFGDFRYKEAVLDPTNPRDLADDRERAIIDKFIADPSLTETSGEIIRGLRRFYYVARPIQIKNGACLACHDTPARAPATMLSIYGDKGGFGWKLNQVVGSQIVVVPAFEQDVFSNEILKAIAIVAACALVALFAGMNFMLGRRRQ